MNATLLHLETQDAQGNPQGPGQIRENLENENPRFVCDLLGIVARNLVPEVPRTSCIFLDGRRPFLRRFNGSDLV